MMASSLALHLPHPPIVSQPLAPVAIAPAPAAAVFVPPAVRTRPSMPSRARRFVLGHARLPA